MDGGSNCGRTAVQFNVRAVPSMRPGNGRALTECARTTFLRIDLRAIA